MCCCEWKPKLEEGSGNVQNWSVILACRSDHFTPAFRLSGDESEEHRAKSETVLKISYQQKVFYRSATRFPRSVAHILSPQTAEQTRCSENVNRVS